MNLCQLIENILRNHCGQMSRAANFFTSVDELAKLNEREFLILFAGAPRRLGRQPLTLDASELAPLASHKPCLSEDSAGQLGRMLLTLRCPQLSWLQTLLLKGDDFEKAAILKVLHQRADAGDFLLDIVNVCRGNSSDTYSAIAMNNPYPSQYFSDAQLSQLSLKCLFLQLPFDQIYGLKQRYTEEFGQSLVDLYEERTAAGRPFAPECLQFMKDMKLL